MNRNGQQSGRPPRLSREAEREIIEAALSYLRHTNPTHKRKTDEEEINRLRERIWYLEEGQSKMRARIFSLVNERDKLKSRLDDAKAAYRQIVKALPSQVEKKKGGKGG